jgi:hypothetical protein
MVQEQIESKANIGKVIEIPEEGKVIETPAKEEIKDLPPVGEVNGKQARQPGF